MHEENESDWRASLELWERDKQEMQADPVMAGNVVAGWWLGAFANPPSPSAERGHQCGESQMLIVLAYDIMDHKRLARVAKHCEDHGLRVQYSIFECRLELDEFEMFWLELEDMIDAEEDRIVAYRICASCAQRIFSLGTMQTNQIHVAYIF